MIAKTDLFATSLRQHGYSVTKTRQTIFAALCSHAPVTIHELVELCPAIDRASVYRSIALFEKISIVRRVYTGWKYKIEPSDNFDHHHHHATCATCGASIVLAEDPSFEEAIRQLAAHYQFAVTSHQVELVGMCANCKAKSR